MGLRRYSVDFDNGDESLGNVGLEELFHPPAPHARPTAHVAHVSEDRQSDLCVLLHAGLAIDVIDAEAPAEAPAVPAAKKGCLRCDPAEQRAKRPRSNLRFFGTVLDNDGNESLLFEGSKGRPKKVRTVRLRTRSPVTDESVPDLLPAVMQLRSGETSFLPSTFQQARHRTIVRMILTGRGLKQARSKWKSSSSGGTAFRTLSR